MFAYRTPGVYFEWLDQRGPALVPLRTDIAGFVGVAASGPLHTPVKVESLTQFVSVFGGHTPQGYLAYAVEGFFANGGQTCWVVRAADPDAARPASFELRDESGQPTLRLTASVRVTSSDGTTRKFDNPGTWGRNITFTVSPSARDRFTLVISLGNAREIWRDLSLHQNDPQDDARERERNRERNRNVEKLLNDPRGGSRLVRADILHSPAGFPRNTPDARASGLRGGAGRLAGGSDGLKSLTVGHLSGDGAPAGSAWGLAALELIDEISLVAMPDIMPRPPVAPPRRKERPHDCRRLDLQDLRELYKDLPHQPPPWPTLERCVPEAEPAPPPPAQEPVEFAPAFGGDQIRFLQASLVLHCEKLRDRVAVLDTPLLDPEAQAALTPELAAAWRNNFDTKYAALYFPWLRVPDPLRIEGLLRAVPPSGHVAGVWARGDRRVGVHKPPANEELEGVNDVEVAVEDITHGHLNARSVNVIRAYPGRGLRVAGARTLSSDAEWRFLNVRRLLIMIEEAIDEGTQWTVFEPHNPELWRDVDRVARTFLESLWRRGMLDGATREEAFSVRCDETTNTPEETDAGRLVCEIGLLPPWPAEFVIVRIGKTEGGTEIIEEEGITRV